MAGAGMGSGTRAGDGWRMGGEGAFEGEGGVVCFSGRDAVLCGHSGRFRRDGEVGLEAGGGYAGLGFEPRSRQERSACSEVCRGFQPRSRSIFSVEASHG